MTPTAFELACRDLAERDGLRAQHTGRAYDQGADVIARDSTQLIVIQCKHTATANNVGVGVVYTVNGTARPIHHANIAIIATNGGFTLAAKALAPQHDIHLLDRKKLRRWASEGHDLHSVLGLPRTRQISAR